MSDDPAPTTEHPFDMVKRLATRLTELGTLIEESKAHLKLLQEEFDDLSFNKLPTAMNNLDTPSIGVGNHKVVTEPWIKATLPVDPTKRKAAINFLIDNGHGGVVNYALEVDFPKGDAVLEQRILDAITAVDANLRPHVTPSIHHSTYSAICRKLIQTSGKPVPKEILGIYVATKAIVTES